MAAHGVLTIPMCSQHSIPIKQGTEILAGGRRGFIAQLVDLNSVLVRDAETGQTVRCKVSDLRPPTGSQFPQVADLDLIPDHDWQIAQHRLEVIRPLLAKPGRNRAEVAERASAFDLHLNTVYKWLLVKQLDHRATYWETHFLSIVFHRTILGFVSSYSRPTPALQACEIFCSHSNRENLVTTLRAISAAAHHLIRKSGPLTQSLTQARFSRLGWRGWPGIMD